MLKIYDLGQGYKEEITDGIFLTETNKEMNIGDNIELNSKTYTICNIYPSKNLAGVREFNFVEDEEVEETSEEVFTCPYCNYKDDDAFELPDYGEIECPQCGSKLKYEREVTVSYNVEPIEKAEIIKMEE